MQSLSAPTIELYTTSTCPDCRQLKTWFDQLGIP
ncbi:MAG: glutaredoxin family protein [Paracoccus sp. (in: a-proteobacteria)]